MYKNSASALQQPHQRTFYRSSASFKSLSPEVQGARNFSHNIQSYTNVKKTQNTIDKTNV